MDKQGFATRAVHAGQSPDPVTGSVVVPIYSTSTFAFKDADQGAARFAGAEEGYIYTRLGNPTTRALEKNVAALESGEDARASASGMAAITTAVMSVIKKGDHVVSTDCIYGGTVKLFLDILSKYGVDFTLVDSSDTENVKSAIRENTKLIYLETPANPTLKLDDNIIFFWESIGQPIDELDAKLVHFRESGLFDKTKGMLVGKFRGEVPDSSGNVGQKVKDMTDEIKELVLDIVSEYNFPIIAGLDFGHHTPNLPLPMGIKATMDSDGMRVWLNESYVKER